MSLDTIDPIQGTELMDLLGVEYYDLESPAKFRKFDEISKHFRGKQNLKGQILKILQKRPFEDKMDAVWRYVQLEKERERIIERLPQDEFAENIQQELKNKYLTRDNLKLLRNQVDERMEAAKKRGLEKREEMNREKKEQAAMGKTMKDADTSNLSQIKKSLEEIEAVQEKITQEGYA